MKMEEVIVGAETPALFTAVKDTNTRVPSGRLTDGGIVGEVWLGGRRVGGMRSEPSAERE